MEVEIAKALPSEYSICEEFYKTVGYETPIDPGDFVLMAKSSGDCVGVVRICEEFNSLVLRGMMIAESIQRTGVGSQMLKVLEPTLRRDCYCIPHDWLESFYGQIGFQKIEESLAPEHLKSRINEYRKRFPRLIMMKRSSN